MMSVPSERLSFPMSLPVTSLFPPSQNTTILRGFLRIQPPSALAVGHCTHCSSETSGAPEPHQVGEDRILFQFTILISGAGEHFPCIYWWPFMGFWKLSFSTICLFCGRVVVFLSFKTPLRVLCLSYLLDKCKYFPLVCVLLLILSVESFT